MLGSAAFLIDCEETVAPYDVGRDAQKGGLITTKERLHCLIDDLPESILPEAERLLESLRSGQQDPILRAFLEAPLDDEPDLPEDTAGDQEAWEDLKAGRVYSLEKVRKDLDL